MWWYRRSSSPTGPLPKNDCENRVCLKFDSVSQFNLMDAKRRKIKKEKKEKERA